MAPPKASSRHISNNNARKDQPKDKKKPAPRRPNTTTANRKGKSNPGERDETEEDPSAIDLSATIPLTLQQLLLNVFKTGLLSADGSGLRTTTPHEALDIKTLVQTIKSHLYKRDFDSAFTDASEELLCAYALRWSASRALGYAGVLKGVLMESGVSVDASEEETSTSRSHVVCIGGGAGAEIVALAAVWRDLMTTTALEEGMKRVSLGEEATTTQGQSEGTAADIKTERKPRLAVTAVDIADWSRVVDRLSTAIQSPHVTGGKTHPAPLLKRVQQEENAGEAGKEKEKEKEEEEESPFAVRFRRADILTIPDADFKTLLRFDDTTPATLVTLMFTLNELFSTSMAKATGFLLRITEMLDPGTLLLVVDSPGSYSTVKLGKGEEQRERQYPMKFLLDHALLSVLKGQWEKVLSQDSRWWRRDAARLGYDVGEGAGLEDMRYQIHVYRRV